MNSKALLVIFFAYGALAQLIPPLGTSPGGKILVELMKRPYDKRVAPSLGGGELILRIALRLLALHSIKEGEAQIPTVTTTIELTETWLEPRLTFPRGVVLNETIQLPPGDSKLLWTPGTRLDNRISCEELSESAALISNGQVWQVRRFLAETTCELSGGLPFDIVTCSIAVATGHDQITFEWDEESGETQPFQWTLPQWHGESRAGLFRTRKKGGTTLLTLRLRRRWGTYWAQLYLPLLTLGLVAIWVQPGGYSLAVLISTVAIIAFHPLPGRSTQLDHYANFTFVFVLISLAATAWKTHPHPKQLTSEAHNSLEVQESIKTTLRTRLAKVGKYQRVTFSLIFAIYNIFYFGLNSSGGR